MPLVLAGHEHRQRADTVGEALTLVEGSTGGAGLRGLEGDEPLPLECTVLYVDAANRRLQAYDAITVSGLGGLDARSERTVLPRDTAAPASPVPTGP